MASLGLLSGLARKVRRGSPGPRSKKEGQMTYLILLDEPQQRQEWSRKYRELVKENLVRIDDKKQLHESVIGTQIKSCILGENTSLGSEHFQILLPNLEGSIHFKTNFAIEEFLKLLESRVVADKKITKFFT